MKKIISQLILIYLFIIPISLISAETVLKIGKSDAKVTIKVFSSLTCPHCAKFHENIFSRLKSEYIDAGKVTFEHHSFPLDLAALNAEKLIRCSSSVEKNFDNYFKYSKEIPSKKLRNRWRFNKTDLDKWKSLKKSRTVTLSMNEYKECFEFAMRIVYSGVSSHGTGIRGFRSEVQLVDDFII